MISVVIPIFNEAILLDELKDRCVNTLEKIGELYEVIFVDDGSEDQSLPTLLRFHRENKQIKVVELSRNFGHQVAFTAGLQVAKGEYVVMMDGDLQDPPELIEELYEKLKANNLDVVNAHRTSRSERGLRRFSQSIFHLTFEKLSHLKTEGNYGNFAMLNRKALEALLSLEERNRYLPGLRSFIGFKQDHVEYDRSARKAGKPGMSAKKLISLAVDAIYSFSRFPIQLCFYIGLVGAVLFLIIGCAFLFNWLPGFPWPANASTLISLIFIGCVQLLFIGLMGEYIFRSYQESQNRPLYFVRNKYLD